MQKAEWRLQRARELMDIRPWQALPDSSRRVAGRCRSRDPSHRESLRGRLHAEAQALCPLDAAEALRRCRYLDGFLVQLASELGVPYTPRVT